MGYADGKSWTGDTGEKLFRVVGFGALSDIGGFVLGLSIGGDSGRGTRLGRCCFGGPAVAYMFPIGQVAVVGGDSGRVTGYESLRDPTGFDRNGLGNVDLDMAFGDSGGDGVDSVDKKVGP